MNDGVAEAISAWVRETTGCQGVHVGEVLAGATTATIQTCLALRADGSVVPLVVKIYDRGIDGVGPDDVRRDAAALTAGAEAGLAMPRLVVADPTGGRLGHAAIVMTRLHGAPDATGEPDPAHWVDGLADALADIHDAPQPTSPLPPFEHWLDPALTRPGWFGDDGLWGAMAEALSVPLPRSAPRFIHRDFHPLNVLWKDGRVTGTVDWVNGCLGPIETDIASCRINIALLARRDGFALADRFLDRCRDRGLPWHPVWDVDFVAGIDRPGVFLVSEELGAPVTSEAVTATLEEAADRALHQADATDS